MAFEAGRRILASYLDAFRMGNSALGSNDPQTVAAAFEEWGAPIVFPNPGIEVAISGTAMGYGANSVDASSYGSLRVEVSFDGGSTWNAGTALRQDIGSGAADVRGALSPVLQISGTPTGDVHVRVTHSSGSTNTAFWSGSLIATMMPTGG